MVTSELQRQSSANKRKKEKTNRESKEERNYRVRREAAANMMKLPTGGCLPDERLAASPPSWVVLDGGDNLCSREPVWPSSM